MLTEHLSLVQVVHNDVIVLLLELSREYTVRVTLLNLEQDSALSFENDIEMAVKLVLSYYVKALAVFFLDEFSIRFFKNLACLWRPQAWCESAKEFNLFYCMS